MGSLGNLSPQGSVAVGVIVGLISTSLQAIGLTLQRKSHILEDEKHPYDIRRPPYRRRRWQIGMSMFVISNIVGSTIQITTLPLPVLSTLQASGLVFNTAFATLMLGEPFTRYSFFGTVLVCGGAVLIATFGAVGEPAHTLDQLLELLQRRSFILWMMGTAIVMLVILLGSNLIKIISTPARSKHSTSTPALLCGRIRVPHVQIAPSRVRLIRGMCYGLVSGILSAHSLLLAKSAVELLVRTIVDRVNQFNRWQSWVILLSMIFLALSQLFYLHRGLKLCSTSVLYPFVFCIYNIIAILDGLIYFRQAAQLAGLHAGLIALGTVVLLSGVLCLSWRLEDIDSHTGGGVVGSSQTALGPGMGVIEPHAESPLGMGLSSGDEEAQLGEREPLLLPHARFPPQRAPSMPLMGHPLHRQSTTSAVHPASIWAELDDSDYDYSNINRSDILARPLLEHPDQHNTHHRPRSQSGSVVPFLKQDAAGIHYPPLRGTARHSQAGTIGGRRSWDLRRTSPGWRRTSAPVTVDQVAARSRRRTFWGPYHVDGNSNLQGAITSPTTINSPTPSTRGGLGYGTVDSDTGSANHPEQARHDRSTSPPPPDNNSQDTTIGLLAGSRRTLTGAWRRGLRLLSLRGGREPERETQQQPRTGRST